MIFPILETTDYDKFVLVNANREIVKPHLKKLIASIQRKNMLNICPIIVSSSFEIIDGQHRLEAARALETPLYYIVGDDLEHEDIISLNNVKLSWTLMDYINFYTIKKKPDYVSFSKMLNQYRDLTVPCALMLISKDGRPRTEFVKSGNIDIDNIGNFPKLAEMILDYKECVPFWDKKTFVQKIRWAAMGELPPRSQFEYNHDQVMQNIRYKKVSFVSMLTKYDNNIAYVYEVIKQIQSM